MSEPLPTCTWCHELPADDGLDPIGEPWCVRCRDAETAVQNEARERQERDARAVAAGVEDGANGE